MKILVLNCGSSSVKFSVLAPQSEKTYLSGLIEKIGSAGTQMIYKIGTQRETVTLENADYDAALKRVFELVQKKPEWKNNLAGVGHRVVHGGEYFKAAALVTPDALNQIKKPSATALG